MVRPSEEIVVASRKSPLALAQAELAIASLGLAMPGFDFRIEKMVTTGDRRREWSLEEKGGKGLFTKELEDALLEERADLAVHSAKDLPSEMPEGLSIAGFLARETPRCPYSKDDDLPALIATEASVGGSASVSISTGGVC